MWTKEGAPEHQTKKMNSSKLFIGELQTCVSPHSTPGMCGYPAVVELAIWGFRSHLVFCEFTLFSFLKQQTRDGASKGLISTILNQRIADNTQLYILWMLSLLCILSISLMRILQSTCIGLHTVKIYRNPSYLIKRMLNVIGEGCYNR